MLAVCVAAAAAAAVPTVQIAPGVDMPTINLGTCCGSSPRVGLEPWLDAGGTGIDTALDYNDQADIARILKSHGGRDKLFITTKIPAGLGFGQCTGANTALSQVKQDVQQLGVDYVDLVLLHGPCPAASQNAALWKGLEQALDQKLTRAIGISNYKKSSIEALLKSATVKPAVNQCSMSAKTHDDATISYCQSQGITYEAYDTLKGCPTTSAAVKSIATKYGKSVQQVCLRYIVDRGCVMATGTGSSASTAGTYAQSDLDIFDFKLTSDEVAQVGGSRPPPLPPAPPGPPAPVPPPPPPAPAACVAELEKDCAGDQGNDQACSLCVLANAAGLRAAGCNIVLGTHDDAWAWCHQTSRAALASQV